MRFDDALKLLSQDEFWISEARIMTIVRQNCHNLKDIHVKPVPKVRKPRLTARQLKLFEENNKENGQEDEDESGCVCVN